MELFHRQIVVAVHEAARDVLVQGVGEHGVASLGIGRMTADQLIPPRLGVEHRRPQLAARGDPDRAHRLVGHPRRHVAELSDAERVGQTACWIDGQYEHPAALLGRRGHAEGGGDGRLADPAGTADEDHLLARQQRLEPSGQGGRGGSRHGGRAGSRHGGRGVAGTVAVAIRPRPALRRGRRRRGRRRGARSPG